jgi:hypothetical protein
MVIPQFGMIIRLLRYRWFYKLKLLVVLFSTVFVVPCSHFQFLYVSFVLCSLHASILPSSSLVFQVLYHAESMNIVCVEVSFFRHIVILSFLDSFQGLVILKQKENL